MPRGIIGTAAGRPGPARLLFTALQLHSLADEDELLRSDEDIGALLGACVALEGPTISPFRMALEIICDKACAWTSWSGGSSMSILIRAALDRPRRLVLRRLIRFGRRCSGHYGALEAAPLALLGVRH